MMLWTRYVLCSILLKCTVLTDWDYVAKMEFVFLATSTRVCEASAEAGRRSSILWSEMGRRCSVSSFALDTIRE